MAKTPADHFIDLLSINVDNEKLSDKDFRQFIRNSVPVAQAKPRRQYRCPHGVSSENHCERCD